MFKYSHKPYTFLARKKERNKQTKKGRKKQRKKERKKQRKKVRKKERKKKMNIIEIFVFGFLDSVKG